MGPTHWSTHQVATAAGLSPRPAPACPVHTPVRSIITLPVFAPWLAAATGLVTGSGILATPAATPAATGPGG